MKHPFLTALLIAFVGILAGVIYFVGTTPQKGTQGAAIQTAATNSEILQGVGQTGQASCDSNKAYAYLQGKAVGNGWKITPKVGSTGGLDPEFACRLERFFRAGGCSNIFSAYRGKADTMRACGTLGGRKGCNAYGNSCHNYGLAVDAGGCSQADKSLARKYGLHFPYNNSHIQCAHISAPRCSKDTPPCAKGWKSPSSPDDDATPPSNDDYQPPPSAQSTPQDIADQLGQGIPPGGGIPSSSGGSSSLSSAAPFVSEPYNPDEYGGEVGDVTDTGFLGDGAGFEELLGDFGEFGEGSETREILGFESNTTESQDGTVPVTSEGEGRISVAQLVSPNAATEGDSSTCIDGIPTRTIYGTVCAQKKDTTEAKKGIPIFSSTVFEGKHVLSDLSDEGKGVNVFAQYIEPIRHLLDDSKEDHYSYDSHNSHELAYGRTSVPTATLYVGGQDSPEDVHSQESEAQTQVARGALLVLVTALKLVLSVLLAPWIVISNTLF